ncbi:MAG: response regulator [Desulfobacteraceae bacterium]|nr:MAG: response regulator [Desulfobacteraceae bacterium]
MCELPLVLMADDDTDNWVLAKDAFEVSGAPVMMNFVEDGIELLNYLSTCGTPPALILLDLNMPRKDGLEALKEVKSVPSLQDIPIAVLTTSREKDDFIKCREAGANSFISKPASFSEWIKLMRSLADTWLVTEY